MHACHAGPGVNRTGCEHKLQGKAVDEFPLSEFAEAVEDRRRNEDRKSVVPALAFLSHPVPNCPKQEVPAMSQPAHMLYIFSNVQQ